MKFSEGFFNLEFPAACSGDDVMLKPYSFISAKRKRNRHDTPQLAAGRVHQEKHSHIMVIKGKVAVQGKKVFSGFKTEKTLPFSNRSTSLPLSLLVK